MKNSIKIFFATSLLATAMLSLNAQLTVTQNGQTIFGDRYNTSSSVTPISEGGDVRCLGVK